MFILAARFESSQPVEFYEAFLIDDIEFVMIGGYQLRMFLYRETEGKRVGEGNPFVYFKKKPPAPINSPDKA